MAVCFLFCFLLLFVCRLSVTAEEEQCFSKFKYDKQMLETMVRMEAKMEQWDKERKTFEEYVLSILEHRREEMDEVFHTQTGKLEKERDQFEKRVLSMLEDRQEEMDEEFQTQRQEKEEVFLTQNRKLETLIVDFNDVRDDVRNTTAVVAESIKVTPKVAFNAYTTTPRKYKDNEVVIFPNVLLNAGGGYNSTTGEFTAPISGLYHFHTHVCHHAGRFIVVSIVHGNESLATTSGYENNGESCSSVSAPALVNEGENVFIESSFSESRLYAAAIYRWPSFSGFLVNE